MPERLRDAAGYGWRSARSFRTWRPCSRSSVTPRAQIGHAELAQELLLSTDLGRVQPLRAFATFFRCIGSNAFSAASRSTPRTAYVARIARGRRSRPGLVRGRRVCNATCAHSPCCGRSQSRPLASRPRARAGPEITRHPVRGENADRFLATARESRASVVAPMGCPQSHP